MGHKSCCVVGCKNNGRNSNCKFYRFPRASWNRELRIKWISAVKRKNPDGSPWVPKEHDVICNAHFVGGQKAYEEASPSYIPSIFPDEYKSKKVNENAAMSRHKRFREGRNKKEINSDINVSNLVETVASVVDKTIKNPKIDKECQINTLTSAEALDNEEPGKILICNRFIFYEKRTGEAEVQTEITINPNIMKVYKVVQRCNTPRKSYLDKETLTENVYFSLQSSKSEF